MSTCAGESESSREARGSADDVDLESELLWGTPTSVVSWITFPAFIVIFGILGEIFLVRTVRNEFGFLAWAQLAARAVIVIVGVALAWAGCLAYSRITVTDTMRFHRATAVGVAILSTVLVVTGIFGGSNPQVLAGFCDGWTLDLGNTVSVQANRVSVTSPSPLPSGFRGGRGASGQCCRIGSLCPRRWGSAHHIGLKLSRSGDRLLRRRGYRMRRHCQKVVGRKPGRCCPITQTWIARFYVLADHPKGDG